MRFIFFVFFLNFFVASATYAKPDCCLAVGMTSDIYYLALGGEVNVLMGQKLSLGGGMMTAKNSVKAQVETTSVWSSLSNADVNINQADITLNMLYLKMRYFPMSGSFNFALAGGYTDVEGALQLEENGNIYRETNKIDNTFAFASIGNLWIFSTIYFGFDWGAYYRIIDWQRTHKREPASGPQSDDLDDVADEFGDVVDAYGKDSHLTFLRFNLGFVF